MTSVSPPAPRSEVDFTAIRVGSDHREPHDPSAPIVRRRDARSPARRPSAAVIALALAAATTLAAVVPGPGPPSAAASPAAVATAPDQAPPETSEDPASNDDEIAFTRSVLLDPGSSAELRREAVERLVRTGTPAAIAVLAEALGRTDPAILGTTIQTLAQANDADDEVLQPLVGPMLEALPRAPSSLLDPIGLLLSRLDAEDRAPVRVMATDPQRPPTERLAAIHVLGVLATIESGDTLIELTDPERTDDPALQRAAREALARMVGRDLGEDHSAWASWWSEARRRGLADWWREIRRSDREQIARLQSDFDALAARHVELLRQLYAGFDHAAPSTREVELLQAHLGDPVSAVRRFAISRVERMVRDSIPVPEPLLAPIAARLDDEVPAIRGAAVGLLDELESPGLSAELAARLPSEPDPAAASAMLDVLGRRAAVDAADAIVARLEVPATAPAAARAAWRLARDAALPTAARERAAELADRRLAADPDAADAARLLAAIGDDAAVEGLALRLTAEAPAAVAGAIAEGLASRGRLEPLLAAADVPSVRPVLIDALADGEATEEQLRRLLDVEPSFDDGDRRGWERGVARLARRLPPGSVLAVEASLASAEDGAWLDRRRLILVPAARAAAIEAGREDAPELARAAADVLLALGRASEAWTLLDELEAVAAHESLRTPRARAGMLTGRYDEAAAIDPDPAVWLDVLAEAVARAEFTAEQAGEEAENAVQAAETARRLAAEIARRFEGGLDPEQRAALDRMLAVITPGAGDADPGAAGDPGAPRGLPGDGAALGGAAGAAGGAPAP